MKYIKVGTIVNTHASKLITLYISECLKAKK